MIPTAIILRTASTHIMRFNQKYKILFAFFYRAVSKFLPFPSECFDFENFLASFPFCCNWIFVCLQGYSAFTDWPYVFQSTSSKTLREANDLPGKVFRSGKNQIMLKCIDTLPYFPPGNNYRFWWPVGVWCFILLKYGTHLISTSICSRSLVTVLECCYI